MKHQLIRLRLALKASQELGFARSFWYLIYQLGLQSGHYCRTGNRKGYERLDYPLASPYRLPERSQLEALLKAGFTDEITSLIAEADEIAAGKVRLFGGPPVPLNLKPADASRHWTVYEGHPETWGVEDIKFIWEPARFNWVYTLGRAYHLTGNETYAAAFWRQFEFFLAENPPDRGPNWSSAQEVALRILSWLFAARAFERSPHTTTKNVQLLAGAVAAHARRIPATLSYSLAQNNNHLITEALGMYAAGCALPDHPRAGSWRKQGWRWLNRALTGQIRPGGTYTQHSMNYHRLMLHAALQAVIFGTPYPKITHQRLASAARWLLAQIDWETGQAPNLGSNDGANILPLAPGGFHDFRPVAQAACRAFLGQPAFPPGPWDELCLWLKLPFNQKTPLLDRPESRAIQSPGSVHRLGDRNNWASIRAVHFTERPSHADQLHVDLWWRGENIAKDAGTFRYTAADPWNNTLSRTCVHNTVEINGQDQMLRAGRFLWLDWAQAQLLNTQANKPQCITAQHDGYRRFGVLHRRELKQDDDNHWTITDHLLEKDSRRHDRAARPVKSFFLHWLLPDWPWEFKEEKIALRHPAGRKVTLKIKPVFSESVKAAPVQYSLVRAGKPLIGPKDVNPVLGWYSPSYNLKIPALSFSMTVQAPVPLILLSEWELES